MEDDFIETILPDEDEDLEELEDLITPEEDEGDLE